MCTVYYWVVFLPRAAAQTISLTGCCNRESMTGHNKRWHTQHILLPGFHIPRVWHVPLRSKSNMQGMLWHVLPVHLAFPSVTQATDHKLVLCVFYPKARHYSILHKGSEFVAHHIVGWIQGCELWSLDSLNGRVWPSTRPRPLGTFTRWRVCCSASSPQVTWSWHQGFTLLAH